jgi:hypothetical protein
MRVFVCSQYGGDVEENVRRVVKYCRKEIYDGNSPYAPHLYLPSILDDDDPTERLKGIACGLEFLAVCDEVHVYVVSGIISSGMKAEIKFAQEIGRPIVWFNGLDMWELDWEPIV